MLAIIGGDPKRIRPYVDLYRRAFEQTRQTRAGRSACIRPATSPTTDEEAREAVFPTISGCATG